MSDDVDCLARFLRSRREAVRPAEVGLPTGGRRRTPGLRRAELATLAGISVDYLVRLEQGRDDRPSSQVLKALADALRLSPEDRLNLGHLAALAHKRELYASLTPPADAVRPSVQAVLDHVDPAPAFVLNRVGDLLAWTSGYNRLAEPLGLLDGRPPNLVRFTFTDPRAREVFPDWTRAADEQMTHLRGGGCGHDPATSALVDELSVVAGEAFVERWASRPAVPVRWGLTRLHHPDAGELRLEQEILQLPDPDDQRLVLLLPADAATSAALDRLAGRHPGALRAVDCD